VRRRFENSRVPTDHFPFSNLRMSKSLIKKFPGTRYRERGIEFWFYQPKPDPGRHRYEFFDSVKQFLFAEDSNEKGK